MFKYHLEEFINISKFCPSVTHHVNHKIPPNAALPMLIWKLKRSKTLLNCSPCSTALPAQLLSFVHKLKQSTSHHSTFSTSQTLYLLFNIGLPLRKGRPVTAWEPSQPENVFLFHPLNVVSLTIPPPLSPSASLALSLSLVLQRVTLSTRWMWMIIFAPAAAPSG
jgi:hypothetical protein